MNIGKAIKRLQVAILQWKLRRLELARKRTLADFMNAVDDGQHTAQDLYFQRGTYINRRKAQLESQIRNMRKEVK